MAKRMTGSESRSLSVGSRVCWRDDKNDQATVTETNWSGVTLKWDNRVAQPAHAGRRIYPPPCKLCSGKGRIRSA
jgi:hypothetical protein